MLAGFVAPNAREINAVEFPHLAQVGSGDLQVAVGVWP
jgi:hypothetical protein